MKNPLRAFYEYNPQDLIVHSLAPTVIEHYKKIMPACVINIWETVGLPSHKDGFFWFVNPDEYSALINAFIHDGRVRHVIMRTAFGGLIYMDESVKDKKDSAEEVFQYLCPIYRQTTSFTSDFEAVLNGWLTSEEIYSPLMFYDLFIAARKKLEVPKVEECYGFKLAIALGGELEVENIHLVNIKAYLNILSQLS